MIKIITINDFIEKSITIKLDFFILLKYYYKKIISVQNGIITKAK